jgi:NADH:ubiquinone oxidoreductase subunit 3 (subunit A)
MDVNSVLTPPLAFLILLAAAAGLSFGLSRLSFKKRTGNGGLAPYACGEDIPTHMIQPDYSQFLPFAMFFTVLHVVALMGATVAKADLTALVIAGIYLVGAFVGLTVLYRR